MKNTLSFSRLLVVVGVFVITMALAVSQPAVADHPVVYRACHVLPLSREALGF